MKLRKLSILIIIYSYSLILVSGVPAKNIATQDGVMLQFSDSSGSLDAVSINGQSLPFFGNSTGGLAIVEGHSVTSTSTLFTHGFETNIPPWNNAQNDNWTTGSIYYSWLTSGGVGDTRCLKLGNGSATGCGIAFNQLLPVSSGLYRISWSGKSMDTTSKYIFCIRLFAQNSTDITLTTTAPSGWGYSATSKAHYVCGMTNTIINTWESFNYTYTMPEGIEYITISLRYWNGGDFYVYVDDLLIEKIGGIEWEDELPIIAPLVDTGQPNPPKVEFNYLPFGKNLSVTLTYTQYSEYIQVDGELQDISSPLQTRFYKIYYTLPLNATGWFWYDDIYKSRSIDTATALYENPITIQNRKVAKYPFTCVANSSTGLTLAQPMDMPRIQNSFYRNNLGLRLQFDVAVSPATNQLGAGKATFRFYLYKLNVPEWGFRATAKKYYTLLPDYFIKRTDEEGCWEYPIPPTQVPNPEDFGFKFFETYPQSSTVIDTCNQKGIEIYHYHEPWGTWMSWGYATAKPTYDERTSRLISWAQDTLSSATWLRAPRWYTAQAVLNSAYRDDSSRYYIDANSYLWHQWSGSSAWNQFWPVNPDRNLPQPNTGTLYKDYLVDYRATDATGGMYVDSILAEGSI
ncbi:MAG: hypothetical protein QME64_08365, partial [bacterium]|nr:hypothetical protein [bacterium]